MNTFQAAQLIRAFEDVQATSRRMRTSVDLNTIHTDEIDERAAGALCEMGLARRHRNFDLGVCLTPAGIAAAGGEIIQN